MKSQIRAPQAFRTTGVTPTTNALIKTAGQHLLKAAADIEALSQENDSLRQKVSEDARRKELTQVALECVDLGTMSARDVLSKVSSWLSEGHPADFYRRQLLQVSGSFVAPAGATKTSGSRVDNLGSSGAISREGQNLLRALTSPNI